MIMNKPNIQKNTGILGLLGKYEHGFDLDEMKFYLNGKEIIG